jgi:hypothetical protein
MAEVSLLTVFKCILFLSFSPDEYQKFRKGSLSLSEIFKEIIIKGKPIKIRVIYDDGKFKNFATFIFRRNLPLLNLLDFFYPLR